MLYFFVLVCWGCTIGAISSYTCVPKNFGRNTCKNSHKQTSSLTRVRHQAAPKLHLNANLNILLLGRNKQSHSPAPGTQAASSPAGARCPWIAFLSFQGPLVAKPFPSPSWWLFILHVEQLLWKAWPFNTTPLFRLDSKLSSFLVKAGLFFPPSPPHRLSFFHSSGGGEAQHILEKVDECSFRQVKTATQQYDSKLSHPFWCQTDTFFL